jgi:hypothetical protein
MFFRYIQKKNQFTFLFDFNGNKAFIKLHFQLFMK